jgi:hypothetical protein
MFWSLDVRDLFKRRNCFRPGLRNDRLTTLRAIDDIWTYSSSQSEIPSPISAFQLLPMALPTGNIPPQEAVAFTWARRFRFLVAPSVAATKEGGND